MKLIVKETNQLSTDELTKIFLERIKVFVVEQNCTYQEIDEFDIEAKHLILKEKEKIIAYTRIIERQDNISFGRVLVTKQNRGKNYGRKIVKESIDYIRNYTEKKMIYISAQEHLKDFYSSFGFEKVSTTHIVDGIPHIDMILKIDRIGIMVKENDL